jgi:4'-phosphopantetheinyl transferase
VAKYLKHCFNARKWLPTRDEWSALIRALSKNECDMIYEYVFKSDCKFRLMSALLMRHSVTSLLNVNWNEVTIERTSKGRPYCLNSNLIDFNTSHNGDYVIVSAVLRSNEYLKTGSDVMKVETSNSRQLDSFRRIMNDVFTVDEIAHIEMSPNIVDQLLEFNRVWSLKESFVKAIGDGIGFELKRIDFQIASPLRNAFSTNDTCVFVDLKKKDQVKFTEELFDGHVMTVCLLNESPIDHIDNAGDFEACMFKELNLVDILAVIGPVQLGFNREDDEKYWTRFCNKVEKPG